MNRRTAICVLTATVLVGGCIPPTYYVWENKADDLRAEIQNLAADLTSTNDADCGIVSLGEKGCGGPEGYVVYSRATVDEEILLEKVREYNELRHWMNEQFQLPSDCMYVIVPVGARSENGVCVAGTRSD